MRHWTSDSFSSLILVCIFNRGFFFTVSSIVHPILSLINNNITSSSSPVTGFSSLFFLSEGVFAHAMRLIYCNQLFRGSFFVKLTSTILPRALPSSSPARLLGVHIASRRSDNALFVISRSLLCYCVCLSRVFLSILFYSVEHQSLSFLAQSSFALSKVVLFT